MKIQINETTVFNSQRIEKEENEPIVNNPVTHWIWIDCSGSMSGSLSKISEDLKNKIPTLVKPEDKLNLGYFSGKGEFGIFQKNLQLKTLQDFKPLNTALENYLRPIGLTGFLEPLQETLKQIDSSEFNNFLFLTDGYDNEWSEAKILDTCLELSKKINSATIVEYGYYCNSNLLEKMSELLQGSHIFSENFYAYTPVMEKFLSKDLGKKISVKLDSKPIDELVFIMQDDNITLLTPDLDNQVSVNENIEQVFYFSTEINSYKKPTACNLKVVRPLFGALGITTYKGSDLADLILASLGDVELIEKFYSAFGKQKILEFKQRCLDIAFNEQDLPYNMPFRKGQNFNLIPKEDTFCLLDLFEILETGNNEFYPKHEEFIYNRTSPLMKRKLIDKSKILDDMLTVSEDETKKLNEQLKGAKQNEIFFKADNKGYPIKLVYNESRVNVNFQVNYSGTVNLPENDYIKTTEFKTNQFRNYTILKDGIINVSNLPVKLDDKTYLKLAEHFDLGLTTDIQLLNISDLPLINRKRVQKITALETYKKAIEVLKLQGHNKSIKYLLEQLGGKETSKNLKFLYGEDGAEFLKTIGITDMGFSPKTEKAESTDFYISKEMEIKIAGKTLGKVSDVIEKYNKGAKLGIGNLFIVEGYLLNKNSDKETLEKQLKLNNNCIKDINNSLFSTRVALITANKWFTDLESREETKIGIDTFLDGIDKKYPSPVNVIVELELKEVKQNI